jgi:hypothetical protein
MFAGTRTEVRLLYSRMLGSPDAKDGVVYFFNRTFALNSYDT